MGMVDANVSGAAASVTSVTWGTAKQLSATAVASSTKKVLGVKKLDATHAAILYQETGTFDSFLVVGSVAANGDIAALGTAINLGGVNESDSVMDVVDSSKVITITTTATDTITARTYNVSGTTLTLDASSALTVTGAGGLADPAPELAVVALSATRALATHTKDSDETILQIQGLQIGSGALAWDAAATDLIDTAATVFHASPELLKINSTTAYVLFVDGATFTPYMSHITDNGSGTPPTEADQTQLFEGNVQYTPIKRMVGGFSADIGRVLAFASAFDTSTSSYYRQLVDRADAIAVNGASVTAPPGLKNRGGTPATVQDVDLIEENADTASFVCAVAMCQGDNTQSGIMFADVDAANGQIRYGYQIPNDDALVGGTSSDCAAAMLTSTRGIMVYVQVTTNLPYARVFDK